MIEELINWLGPVGCIIVALVAGLAIAYRMR